MENYLVSDTTIALGVFAFTLIVCSSVFQWIQSFKYPPGPVGLPIVGYAFNMGKMPNCKLRDLGNVYGDVFSFYIGPQLIICICDHHLAKEILNHPMVLARPPHSFDYMVGKGGMGNMNGEEWQEQRRFAIHTMRNLGLGKGLWERMIQEDALEFVKALKRGRGEPMHFGELLSFSQVVNILSLLFGRHMDPHTDKEDMELLSKFGEVFMEHISAVDINMNLPWLNKLTELLNLSGFKDFIELVHKFENIFKKEIDRRLKADEEVVKEDFIGCYFREIEKRRNDTKPHSFHLENLQGNLFILFLGAHESTIASVGWLLLLMAKHQDVQDRVCHEIDHAIGRDGSVYYDDRTSLPYTTATIYEMMRWVSINPLFPPRYVLESFTFQGYTIPRGSHVVCNSWAMLHDPRYFKDPMSFNPDRFLVANGDKVAKVEGYGPFSFGKRNCPGEGVAMMSMYLYFVTVMQKFNIRAPDDAVPDMDYKFRAGILPNPQKLCFVER